jgi:hypothetical protein
MSKYEKRILKRLALKVKEKVYIDLFLKEGISERTSHATYITLGIYKEGSKTAIHLTKPKACQLSVMLNQLVEEGNNIDYGKLKQKYPDQESWHIY